MCFEVMMAVFEHYDFPINRMPIKFDDKTFKPAILNEVPEVFSNFVKENWKINSITQRHPEGVIEFHPPLGIFELIVWYSQQVYKERIQQYDSPNNLPQRANYESYIEDFKSVKRMLEIIK